MARGAKSGMLNVLMGYGVLRVEWARLKRWRNKSISGGGADLRGELMNPKGEINTDWKLGHELLYNGLDRSEGGWGTGRLWWLKVGRVWRWEVSDDGSLTCGGER